MRIISDFHDYYDCIQSNGIDKTCVYLRKKKEVIVNFNLPQTSIEDFKSTAIGYCGQLYYLIRYNNQSCFTIEELDSAVKLIGSKHTIRHYFGLKRSIPYRKYCNKVFEEFTQLPKDSDIFFKYKTPVFSVIKCKVRGKYFNRYIATINDCLNDFDFARVKHPFTAYQDIYQYLSGVIGVNNPVIPEISDKDMRDIKGFDKWSFKKEPKNG